MFFKKKKKSEVETQNTMQQAGFSEADLALTDEEFFLAEEIVMINKTCSVEDDMVMNVIFINMGADHIFIFSF